MNNIEPKYVTFEQAKWLKEIGFNLPTLNWYHRGNKKFNTNDLLFSMNKLTDNYSAPEQWEVVEWLRIYHSIWIEIKCFKSGICGFSIWLIQKEYYEVERVELYSPQEAYSAAFDYIKNNNLI
jgi:hypothetical protein